MKKIQRLFGDISSLFDDERLIIRIPLLFLMTIVVYFISLKLFYPGFFNPYIPFHDDRFSMFDSANKSLSNFLYQSRPAGSVINYVITSLFLNNFGFLSVLFVYSLIALMSYTLTIIFLEKLFNTKFNIFIIILYLFLLFLHPGFYFSYIYDIINSLSYMILILSLLFFAVNKDRFNVPKYIILFLLIFLTIFTKETYTIPLFLFFLSLLLFKRENIDRKTILISISIIVIISIIKLIFGQIAGSKYVSFNKSITDPYYINTNISSVIDTYLYYIKGFVFNGFLYVLFAGILIMYFFNRKYFIESVLFLIIGLSTYLNFAVLPNHKFVVYYSFTGIPLGFAFILFFNPTINYFKNLKNKNIGIYLQSIFIFLFFFLIIFNLKNNSYAFDYNWNLENQKRNINIFSSFDKIRLEVRDGDKVLVLGLNSNPHSPFQYEFPNHYMKFGNTSWTILDKNDFFNRHWQNVDYQTPDNTYLTDFDKVIIYDNNCNLKSILDKNKINQLGPINSTQLLNLDK